MHIIITIYTYLNSLKCQAWANTRIILFVSFQSVQIRVERKRVWTKGSNISKNGLSCWVVPDKTKNVLSSVLIRSRKSELFSCLCRDNPFKNVQKRSKTFKNIFARKLQLRKIPLPIKDEVNLFLAYVVIIRSKPCIIHH